MTLADFTSIRGSELKTSSNLKTVRLSSFLKCVIGDTVLHIFNMKLGNNSPGYLDNMPRLENRNISRGRNLEGDKSYKLLVNLKLNVQNSDVISDDLN